MKSWDDLKWDRGLDPTERGKVSVNPKTLLPPYELIYKAFDLTPFDKVKAVILGQDPYPTRGHAHGLAFSVPPSVQPLPRSLRNVFREYVSDLHFPWPRNGDLTLWAERGVLLLNTILTVQEGKPLSHKGLGWEKLTIEVIQKLSEYRQGCVFILWGNTAQQYRGLINEDRHLVVAAPHPSPLSADRGFFGHRPFTRANTYLTNPIDWRL
jgi:uracil-DNA glycosylase